ncbi:hypothetical protein ACQBAR_08405 [Propionibacteriaceae bacterium Y1685]|uniref:hypothetical protein n=1 Tax=Microlunatus sp. Y1700 TaxID=3418487 RepID=UPI003B7D9F97
MATWAYLNLHNGTDPRTDRYVVERAGMISMMVPVPAVEDAPTIAAEIGAAVDVPVGHVTFAMDAVIGAGRFSEDD